MKTIEDKTTFKHGEVGSHVACDSRRLKEGLRVLGCCICDPHAGCDFTNSEVIKWRRETITRDPTVLAKVRDTLKEQILNNNK